MDVLRKTARVRVPVRALSDRHPVPRLGARRDQGPRAASARAGAHHHADTQDTPALTRLLAISLTDKASRGVAARGYTPAVDDIRPALHARFVQLPETTCPPQKDPSVGPAGHKR